jgi:hypothetical protein
MFADAERSDLLVFGQECRVPVKAALVLVICALSRGTLSKS